MSLEWSGSPVAKAEIPRGVPWSYALPLKDPLAAVRWSCRLLPRSAWDSDPACPARINVHVPDDLELLFGELTWFASAEGAEPASGKIVFRVIGVRREIAPPAAERVDHLAQPTAPPATVPPEPAALPPTASDTPLTQTQATRFIEVVRGGVAISGFRAAIRPGRTVTIGRGSVLEDHDLDLSQRFETADDETLLSRRQAEVFCNDEGVFIRNVGRHPIKLMDASGSPAGDVPPDHRWSVGEMIALPGKLRVVLREA
jgi:hypothetical protein